MRKILFVVEGAVEYAFFSKFLELCLKAKVCKKEESIIFKERMRLPEGLIEGRVRFFKTENSELALIPSYGNWKYFADAYKILKDFFEKILYVADSEHRRTLSQIPKESKVIIQDCFEDLFFEILENLQKRDEVEKAYLNITKLLKIREEEDKFAKKRKFSLAHSLYGPKCWDHLFYEILKDQNFDPLKIERLKEIAGELLRYL